VYRDQSAEAAAKIQNAFAVYGQMAKEGQSSKSQIMENTINFCSEKYAEIAEAFNLCTVPQNQSDLSSFYSSTLLMSFALNSEFSYGVKVFPNLEPNSLPRLINRTLELDEPLEILNASIVSYFPPDTHPCIPLGGDGGASAGISTTTFLYIGCQAYPLETWAIPQDTIFLPSPGAMPGRVQMCKETYNLDVPDGVEHMTRYNFTEEHIANATRLLFTSGEYDPVSGNSPLSLLGRVAPDRNASRTLLVMQGAHGEEGLGSIMVTKPTVRHAQTIQLNILKEWLGRV
jgi:hypothetical protein